MLVTFDDYKAAGGRAVDTEEEFTPLEAMVEKLVAAYISTQIPFWRTQNLEDYGMDLTFPIVAQMDYMQAHGGLEVFVGNGDMQLKTVNTSGFSYSVDHSTTPMLMDLPLASMAKMDIDRQLLQKGLRSMIL